MELDIDFSNSIVNALICCPDSWKLMYVRSHFTTATEAGYSPTDGKALAVAWAQDNARMFVLGCRDLIVGTDHKPYWESSVIENLAESPMVA